MSPDLEAAERFYRDILGLTLHSRRDNVFAFFVVGNGMLLLFDPIASRIDRGVPTHGAQGPGHLCLAVSESELGGLGAASGAMRHRDRATPELAARRAILLLP